MLLNKTDLISEEEKKDIIERIRVCGACFSLCFFSINMQSIPKKLLNRVVISM